MTRVDNVIPVLMSGVKSNTGISLICIKMKKGGYIYIISNKNRTVLYTGVTSNLQSRIDQHKQGIGSAFAKRYNCVDLLYFEVFEDIVSAIAREKQIKKWKREYKENVINSFNPSWRDLFEEIQDYN